MRYKALPALCRKPRHRDEDVDREKQPRNKLLTDALIKSLKFEQRLLKTVPLTPQSLLAHNLARTLADPSNSGLNLCNRGRFFNFVPARIGHLPLLDAVTDCLLHGIESIKHPKAEDIAANLKRYGYALSLLRKEIAKLEYRKGTASEELVCAVMMLSTYEVSTYPDIPRR